MGNKVTNELGSKIKMDKNHKTDTQSAPLMFYCDKSAYSNFFRRLSRLYAACKITQTIQQKFLIAIGLGNHSNRKAA